MKRGEAVVLGSGKPRCSLWTCTTRGSTGSTKPQESIDENCGLDFERARNVRGTRWQSNSGLPSQFMMPEFQLTIMKKKMGRRWLARHSEADVRCKRAAGHSS